MLVSRDFHSKWPKAGLLNTAATTPISRVQRSAIEGLAGLAPPGGCEGESVPCLSPGFWAITDQKVAGLILGQGRCLGCGPGPPLGVCKRQPINVSLSSSLLSLLSKNK